MSSDDGTVTVRGEVAEVTFRRRYPTSPDDLWDALTTPERAARWLGVLRGDLRPDGAFELYLGVERPDADDVARGRVLTCEPPTGLAVTWAFPGERPTDVRVRVEPDGDGAVLELTHTGLTPPAARGYGGGWHVVLDQLDDHASGRPVRAWDDLFDERVARYVGPS